MRCVSCNVLLSESEDKAKSLKTDERFQMCFSCLGEIAEDIWESLPPDIYDDVMGVDTFDELPPEGTEWSDEDEDEPRLPMSRGEY